MKRVHKQYIASIAIVAAFVFVALMPDVVFAGTTGAELEPAWKKIQEIIGGYGGKLVAGVSLLFALIGSFAGFNPKMVVGAGGVGVTAALGPAFINTTVGALI